MTVPSTSWSINPSPPAAGPLLRPVPKTRPQNLPTTTTKQQHYYSKDSKDEKNWAAHGQKYLIYTRCVRDTWTKKNLKETGLWRRLSWKFLQTNDRRCFVHDLLHRNHKQGQKGRHEPPGPGRASPTVEEGHPRIVWQNIQFSSPSDASTVMRLGSEVHFSSFSTGAMRLTWLTSKVSHLWLTMVYTMANKGLEWLMANHGESYYIRSDFPAQMKQAKWPRSQ